MLRFNEIFSDSNSKLAKDGIVTFSLQAQTTCPRAGACKSYCYASKGTYNFRGVKFKRAQNFTLTKSKKFVTIVTNALQQYKGAKKIIRLHDSGDFYSQNYYLNWISIAIDNPTYSFYAYTKSFAIIDMSILPTNLKIIQSVGGLDDSKINKELPHARIFPNLKTLKKAGYVDCSKSDKKAFNPDTIKVGLIIH